MLSITERVFVRKYGRKGIMLVECFHNCMTMREMNTVVIIKVWKAGDRYIGRLVPPTDVLVRDYVGRSAKAMIKYMDFTFKTSITHWNKGIIIITLPKALNDTWERLWRRNEEVTTILRINIQEEDLTNHELRPQMGE